MDYTDLKGDRQRPSLGHSDTKKAEKQRKQLEKELRMGYVEPDSMRLTQFIENSLERTGKQIRLSTHNEYQSIMKQFVEVVGNMDYKQIKLLHGERFIQHFIDKGNTPDTVSKKVRTLKRFFNLAVERGQLDENPLRFLKSPRKMKKKVRVYTTEQCKRLIRTSRDWPDRSGVRWDILILLAMSTGMRKGELLNLTWRDIDFEQQTVTIKAKVDTASTWRWDIKDNEERTLPLIEDVVSLLAEHQARQDEGYPYVLVPVGRYEDIQQLRNQGKWNTVSSRCNIVGNFSKHFAEIVRRAGLSSQMTFHDLRRTALSSWLSKGMDVFDVMTLAGHSKLTTTQTFYLAVSDDLLTRARQAKSRTIDSDLVTLCHTPCFGQRESIKKAL
jgi:integrase